MHPDFIEYAEMMIKHPNYRGLPIELRIDGTFTWVTTKRTDSGDERLKWAEKKIFEMKIDGADPFAKLMLDIHPTKYKPCQICGKSMSLLYVYPNKYLIKAIKDMFGIEIDAVAPIDSVYDMMVEASNEMQVKKFFIKKFGLDSNLENGTKQDIIDICEKICRVDKSNKLMGPGAMSNFPDRFDGFHSYNRCCRSKEDKGRSAYNMKTYAKDRRAYMYWSDGNIHSANKFMKSDYFSQCSADHIGPISLGFIHDSIILRRMSIGDNSSKRDKLLVEDVRELINIEEMTGKSVINWYSAILWDYIKVNYENDAELDRYRLMLKQNISNFMFILLKIKERHLNGIEFFENYFFKPKMRDFSYNYMWDNKGNIISMEPRKANDANQKEYQRFKRIAIESIDNYFNKSNRNLKPDLSTSEMESVKIICEEIENGLYDQSYNGMKTLIERIQYRLIEKDSSVK